MNFDLKRFLGWFRIDVYVFLLRRWSTSTTRNKFLFPRIVHSQKTRMEPRRSCFTFARNINIRKRSVPISYRDTNDKCHSRRIRKETVDGRALGHYIQRTQSRCKLTAERKYEFRRCPTVLLFIDTVWRLPHLCKCRWVSNGVLHYQPAVFHRLWWRC